MLVALVNGHAVCVFCGQRPKEQADEHVIPKWLIRMTGHEGRSAVLFSHPIDGAMRTQHWLSSKFPACDPCNRRWADIEGIVKGICVRLMQAAPVSVADYIILMDWMDKIRVGSWLSNHMRKATFFDVDPLFHIDSRVRLYDRMLGVYKCGDPHTKRGINLVGPETILFEGMPSCFALRFNNILLVNASTDFLVSKECGFPYPQSHSISYTAESMLSHHADFTMTGRSSRSPRILKLPKACVTIYQPILNELSVNFLLANSTPDVKNYARSNTLEMNRSLGALFVRRGRTLKPFADLGQVIPFEWVEMPESVSSGELAARVIENQVAIMDSISHFPTGSPNYRASLLASLDLKRRNAAMVAEAYRKAARGEAKSPS